MKTRRYKVTMYIDVPLFNSEIQDTDDMEQYLAEKLKSDGIYGTFEVEKAPIMSEVNGDLSYEPEDITDFTHPVGFIAPDGLFYGVESDDNALAHIHLAPEIYDGYADLYTTHQRSSLGVDVTLELMGFIKIHDATCRYYTEPDHPVYWTDEQRKTVYKWMKHMENTVYKGSSRPCSFNYRCLYSHEFLAMDKFAIIKCFI
ncbi:MAG: hypothetical protein [Wendovervirus sonii]|uniref:Uncharacterized protein n=1 Tax=phage Lak_Megaphage_Sonny TaxID=3109229 RepID=A0ABZ0Z2Z2_9CAUD|nr:MAG: hypothetical protein [phage Lak_Megaphage_Sonny]